MRTCTVLLPSTTADRDPARLPNISIPVLSRCLRRARLARAGAIPIYAPGLENFDGGLFKNIPIHEDKRLELRWEVFNVWNHTNLLTPNNSFSSSAFGRITSSKDARIMQVGGENCLLTLVSQTRADEATDHQAFSNLRHSGFGFATDCACFGSQQGDRICAHRRRYHNSDYIRTALRKTLVKDAGISIDFRDEVELLNAQELKGYKLLIMLRDGMLWPSGYLQGPACLAQYAGRS